MTNVVVSKKRTVQVSANATAGIINTTVPVTLKNNTILTGSTRLDRLTDVDANNETSGSTLVYDASTDKYIVQKLDISNVNGDLDGGNF